MKSHSIVHKIKKIEILIGADHPNLYLYTEIKSGNNNEPIALHTTLGWVLFERNQSTRTCSLINKLALNTSTDNLIQKFWDIESYGTEPKDVINVMIVNDKRAMKILPKTTTKYENHYAVGLLWREDNVVLPNNKLLALSMLYNLINKFGKDQNIKQIYTETMKDCIGNGYARQLSEREVKTTSPKINYLPHHGGPKINKPNRLQVMFDAAATYSGTSLNQNLLK